MVDTPRLQTQGSFVFHDHTPWTRVKLQAITAIAVASMITIKGTATIFNHSRSYTVEACIVRLSSVWNIVFSA